MKQESDNIGCINMGDAHRKDEAPFQDGNKLSGIIENI
jgi:hypothetical protein